MNLFYSPPNLIQNDRLYLEGQEAIHASKVLRLGSGDSIRVTDGTGNLYTGEIIEAGSKKLTCRIIEIKSEKPVRPRVTLAMAILKKRDRLEFAAEKATELGVNSIIFFRSDHSEKSNVRTDRIEATVLSAMKQSLRLFRPDIRIMESFDEVLLSVPDEALIAVADQEGENRSMEIEKYSEIFMVIGPEGGMSKREQNLWKERNGKAVLLGDKRLRAETAAIIMADRFCNCRP